ncbi:hypothetical protein NC651_031371 [Populus alba x Populus x berolinensis]|nr:hypothetical protein NC651_031371 [Populus alba x Populus x berolinensis]
MYWGTTICSGPIKRLALSQTRGSRKQIPQRTKHKGEKGRTNRREQGRKTKNREKRRKQRMKQEEAITRKT